MTDTIKRLRTETFEHTINSLLTKRADLFSEAIRIRDRLAEIKNDIGALDRVLGTIGYTGDLDAEMPRQKRHGGTILAAFRGLFTELKNFNAASNPSTIEKPDAPAPHP